MGKKIDRLRDQFAAAAMNGLVQRAGATTKGLDENGLKDEAAIAQWAYAVSDAMLAARKAADDSADGSADDSKRSGGRGKKKRRRRIINEMPHEE